MYCDKCGEDLREKARFCRNCGAPVPERREAMSYQRPAPAPTEPIQIQSVGQQASTSPGQSAGIAGHSPGVYRPYQRTAPGRSSVAALAPRNPYTYLFAGIVAFCGFMIFISTFFVWMAGSGSSESVAPGWQTSISGADLMTKSSDQLDVEGNFVVRFEGGYIWLTGLWSILIGLAIIGAAVLLFLEKRIGPILAIVLGSLIFLMGLLNTIMTLVLSSRGSSEGFSMGAGAGLWLLMFFGIGVVVAASISFRFREA